MTRRHLLTLVVSASLLTSGCGQSGDAKLPLAGEVFVADKLVPQGSISFTSSGGSVAIGAAIENGRFAVARSNGMSTGSYRVEIYGYEPTGKKIEDSDYPGQMVDELRAIVPARYNEHSELVVEVDAKNCEKLSFKLEGK